VQCAQHCIGGSLRLTQVRENSSANTLYILAVDRHDDSSGIGDGRPPVAMGCLLAAAALEEVRVELKARVEFYSPL
jgi:hypothetical protein